ncbi:MAG: thioredoxin domain-containing protein [Saprospiraceae bacterium]
MNKQTVFKIGFWSLFLFGSITLVSCRPQQTTTGSKKPKTDVKETRTFWKVRGTVEIKENPNYTSVFQKAIKKRRPIFISFYSNWCEVCPHMNEEMIKKQPIIGYLEDEFVSFLVNAETTEGYKLATEYSIAAYPTILFLNSEGEEISRYIGLADDYKVMQMAKSAVLAEDKFQKLKEKQNKK